MADNYLVRTADGTPLLLSIDYDEWPTVDPRHDYDNPDHLYAWARGYDSFDANPYPDPAAFLETALEDAFADPCALARAVLDQPQTELRGPDGYGDIGIYLEGAGSAIAWWPAPGADDDTDEDVDVLELRDDQLFENLDTEIYEQVAQRPGLAERLLRDRAALVPVYMLDHSGISYSTRSFRDPWDSGQIGYGYMSLDEATAEWGEPLGITDAAEILDKARDCIRASVELLDDVAQGEVYAFVIHDLEGGDEIDRCSGFYGYDSRDDLLESACSCAGVAQPEPLRASDVEGAIVEARGIVTKRRHEALARQGAIYHTYTCHYTIPVDVTVAVLAGDGEAEQVRAFLASKEFADACAEQRAHNPASDTPHFEAVEDYPDHVGELGKAEAADLVESPGCFLLER